VQASDINRNKELLNYLYGFITEQRKEKFDEVIRNRTRYITIVLEDIFQPHNASAVLRTCDCFGIQDIHIVENKNKYTVNPDVALGSSKWLNLIKYNSKTYNSIDCISTLKKQGYRIVATTPHKDEYMVGELPLNKKIALLFGTEMKGLTDEAIAISDAFVKIPMYGFTESFNISVSAALLLHSLSERLRKSNISWQLSEKEIIEIKLNWVKNTIKSADSLERKFLSNYKERQGM